MASMTLDLPVRGRPAPMMSVGVPRGEVVGVTAPEGFRRLGPWVRRVLGKPKPAHLIRRLSRICSDERNSGRKLGRLTGPPNWVLIACHPAGGQGAL